ncbi:ABC-F family ATP-binding cassette domain-containing protein [Pluralibacter gergoviae]|uniref:ABC-F family ATP-binding cassette domain-containing protein n=1 Tax=Pluralibacter gergoviae TaxID=61647 RepID=UPI002FD95689
MSTLLNARALSVETAFAPLFSDLTFTLQKGDRVGLIGDNGSGKSTLLKLLDGTLSPSSGTVSTASGCLLARIEQHLPAHLASLTLRAAVAAVLPPDERESQLWRVDALLAEMGLAPDVANLTCATLSGGQHTRLLLARALIRRPDVLLLDEPGNHLDLPTLLWLESFIQSWRGGFIMVSHDARLLDNVTNVSWILRDRTLHHFALPCSAALRALAGRDESDALRRRAEQKEIDRVTASAKRLAAWGRDYDNEDLARKAKQMEKQVQRLQASQTALTEGSRWRLHLSGDALPADRLLALNGLPVAPAPGLPALFTVPAARLKSGDRVAIIGRNGGGKSSLLRLIWQHYCGQQNSAALQIHPRVKVGYYDQTLRQLADEATLFDALAPFAPEPEDRKMALISAGFGYAHRGQRVATLSGGERSRLLFVGLSLARYGLLMLDEPTNHLDMAGKAALAEALAAFPGGVLLVSHDRQFIERACSRFWFIDGGTLEEWHDAEALWTRMRETSAPPAGDDEEALLTRLIALESQLAEDLARKPRHQKPERQIRWRQEIDALLTLLEKR